MTEHCHTFYSMEQFPSEKETEQESAAADRSAEAEQTEEAAAVQPENTASENPNEAASPEGPSEPVSPAVPVPPAPAPEPNIFDERPTPMPRQAYIPVQQYGQPGPYGYAPQYNPAAVQSNSSYRAMYSYSAPQPAPMQYQPAAPNIQMNNPQGAVPQGQIPVQNPAAAQPRPPYYSQQPAYTQQFTAQPMPQTPPPPVPPPVDMNVQADGAAVKKTSRGWIIALAVVLVLGLAAVMILLALSDDSKGKVSPSQSPAVSSSREKVTVTIPIQEKPQLPDGMYADKATGLMTTEGVAEYAMPSIVNLYMYSGTTIAASSSASGIIISEDGYIITNAHAVENMDKVKAKLSDDREFEAKIIGIDTRSDLAVVKIEADDLVSADLGDSDMMKSGEQVIAIGNASGYNNSVSVGYVSYVNREVTSYTGYPITCIQTDAVLNFGNSGGALLNMYGQVIGIVTSKYEQNPTDKIGFAISTSFAKSIVEGLISDGYVAGRPRIGITYQLINAEAAEAYDIKPGLRIASIDEECDISRTDLQVDDIITELDGKPMLTANAVMSFQTEHKAGDTVTAKVYRKSITGEESEFEITFALMQDTNSN